jgi:hypothetical protein
MMAAEEQLLIFEGASAGRYPSGLALASNAAKIDNWLQPIGLRR